MIIISHRGNVSSVIESRENSPEYIDEAIDLGFDVEVDLRMKDNCLYLGHDYPEYIIDISWLRKNYKKLWIHCKDEKSLDFLESESEARYFYHAKEKYSIISNKKIWYHFKDEYELSNCNPKNKIVPYIDEKSAKMMPLFDFYGICTDYPEIIKKRLEEE